LVFPIYSDMVNYRLMASAMERPKILAIKSCSCLLAAALLVLSAAAADRPGQKFLFLPKDMPPPFATPGVDNTPRIVKQPPDAHPQVPKGFVIEPFVTGLTNPRWMELAPNGDVFVAEHYAGKISILRGRKVTTFATGFTRPHGLAYHDGALYVGDTQAIWRLEYREGALKAGKRTRVTADGFGPWGNHWTRNIVFGPDGTLYLTIGSASNVGEDPPLRATVQTVDSLGHLHRFAYGLRNTVGIAFYPGSDDLYVTVNERDGLGDGLVPDYFTRIRKDDFFGYPYAYVGRHPDPDYGDKRPDMVAKTKMPDILFESHSAPLGVVFYNAHQFPAAYWGDALIALHGSWDSAHPTGYKIVRVKFTNGRPERGYENFVTGFWVSGSTPALVYGRPAGLLIAKDGSLLIADDAARTIWRVRYVGK